jgi:hypothetical protein
MRHVKIVISAVAIATVGVGVGLGLSTTGSAFNPTPDPPAFGLVTLVSGQSIRVNVVCSEHSVGLFPPGPCRGTLMIHDGAGNVLVTQDVGLRPGQAASVKFDHRIDVPVGINPCFIPSPLSTGHAIPTAEVFTTDTGRTELFLNPAVARLSSLQANRSESLTLVDGR